ncbi:hypothetical protein C8R47DRAFT_1283346 [Mycena vitilis]|nr:hypothetical protein C8R47DRAFT_1283346 [Mycena vitilis]
MSAPSQVRIASVKLHFLVVGGGLAGLTTAYALRTSGHEATIVEQHDVMNKTEGCIRSPPNMTRILAKWPGMESFLKDQATKCTGLSFRSGATSEQVGFMKFHERIMTELQAEFLVIQHDDLHHKLHTLCLDAGVAFVSGTVVELIKLDGEMVVTLQYGKKLKGDIVVGADGHNSLVRSLVVDEEVVDEEVADEEVAPENVVSVAGANISIPTRLIQGNEELRSLCEENEFTLWMGIGSAITGTLNKNAETFNLSICSPMLLDSIDGDMYTNHDLLHLDTFTLSTYDSRLQKLLKLGDSCRLTVQKVFEQKDLMGLDGSIVLVGDAAHPILIHGSHNSSMAVEDAVTLGTLFSYLTDRKQIPILTETYEELRQRRANETRISEYQSHVQISLPPGQLQEDRDTALRLTMNPSFDDFDNWVEGSVLVNVWEQYLVVFSHDACEAVENWWSKWGRMSVEECGVEK